MSEYKFKTRRCTRNILNISITSGLVFLGMNIVLPILPIYALSFQVSVMLTGLAVSFFGLTMFVVDLPAGILGDKYGRKKTMIIGLIIMATSFSIAGVAPNYSVLIFLRARGCFRLFWAGNSFLLLNLHSFQVVS